MRGASFRDDYGRCAQRSRRAGGERTNGRPAHRTQRRSTRSTVAPEDAFALLPKGFDLRYAAAIPLVSLAGSQLVEAMRPKQGDLVLVTGAVGAVGRSAVHAAAQLGARVVAGVRKDEARDLRVEQVVAIDDEAEIARLPPLDRIADTVNGETIAKLVGKIRPGGVLETAEAVARGELVSPIGKRLPLAQAREAQRLAEQGGSGKILLVP